MSRVERTETPSTRRSEQPREAKPEPTPTKAEGEQRDIEQALENQKE